MKPFSLLKQILTKLAKEYDILHNLKNSYDFTLSHKQYE